MRKREERRGEEEGSEERRKRLESNLRALAFSEGGRLRESKRHNHYHICVSPIFPTVQHSVFLGVSLCVRF